MMPISYVARRVSGRTVLEERMAGVVELYFCASEKNTDAVRSEELHLRMSFQSQIWFTNRHAF
jgi:hypothetical protein